jgi:hypothetical protein
MIIQIMATNHFIFANHINALRGDAFDKMEDHSWYPIYDIQLFNTLHT